MHTEDHGMVFKPRTWAAEDPHKEDVNVRRNSGKRLGPVTAAVTIFYLDG